MTVLPENLPRPEINSIPDSIRYRASNMRYREILEKGIAKYADNKAISDKINAYMGFDVVRVVKSCHSKSEWIELINPRLFVYKEQSIGCIKDNWYEAITGLSSRGWGGIHTAPTIFAEGEIRLAHEEDLKTFRLSNKGGHFTVMAVA